MSGSLISVIHNSDGFTVSDVNNQSNGRKSRTSTNNRNNRSFSTLRRRKDYEVHIVLATGDTTKIFFSSLDELKLFVSDFLRDRSFKSRSIVSK